MTALKNKLISLYVLFFLLIANGLHAQNTYHFDSKIVLQGDGRNNYLAIDEINNNLYVTHGAFVHVINVNNQKLVHTIDGMKEARGVAIVHEVNKVFITDGKDNSVSVFNPLNFEKIVTIPVSGKKANAVIFDPYSKKLFVFNVDSHTVNVIDIGLLKEIQTIDLPGEPEYAVPDAKGFMYVNLENKNSVAVINTRELKLVETFPISPCGAPTALTMDVKNKRLFSACRENKGMSVINAETRKVITTLPIGSDVDAISFDEVNKIITVSNADGTATIIRQNSADDYAVIQTLQTIPKAKTFTMDMKSKILYFSASEYDNKTIKPGSFGVYVYML